MATYSQQTVSLASNRLTDYYWFRGISGINASNQGAGFFVARGSRPASWDLAGYAQVFIVPTATSVLTMIDTYEVFLNFNSARLFPEAYLGSVVWMRFVPVPWLGAYNLTGLILSRDLP